jgi:hypothetical protein
MAAALFIIQSFSLTLHLIYSYTGANISEFQGVLSFVLQIQAHNI